LQLCRYEPDFSAIPPQPAMRRFSFLMLGLAIFCDGQSIAARYVPVAFLLRNTVFYRRFVLTDGSLVIVGLASIWLAERAFDMKLLPFWRRGRLLQLCR
jgi:hypothetical protein